MEANLRSEFEQLWKTISLPSFPFAARIDQLQGNIFDQQIPQFIHVQLHQAFQYSPIDFFSKFRVEIYAIIRFFFWKFSIWRNNATTGDKLNNIILVSDSQGNNYLSNFHKIVLGFCTVVFPFLWEKSSAFMSLKTWPLSSKVLFLA